MFVFTVFLCAYSKSLCLKCLVCIIQLSFTWIFSLANFSIYGCHELKASSCNWMVISKGPLVNLCSLKEAEMYYFKAYRRVIIFYWFKYPILHTLPLYSRARWGLKGKGKTNETNKLKATPLCFSGTNICWQQMCYVKNGWLRIIKHHLADIFLPFENINMLRVNISRDDNNSRPQWSRKGTRFIVRGAYRFLCSGHISMTNLNTRVLWLDTDSRAAGAQVLYGGSGNLLFLPALPSTVYSQGELQRAWRSQVGLLSPAPLPHSCLVLS